jgi:hypothetical protein
MAADIIMTIAAIAGIVLVANQIGRIFRTMMMHRTVREAMTRDSGLAPQLLDRIDQEKRGGVWFGEDRIAIVLLAIGFAILGFGALTGDADDVRNMAGIALFPLFVGAALLGRYLIARRTAPDA